MAESDTSDVADAGGLRIFKCHKYYLQLIYDGCHHVQCWYSLGRSVWKW